MAAPVTLSDFDYPLPEELIAQEPVSPRDASRVLVVPRSGGAFEELRFAELSHLLRAGDLLVLNDTRVLPARLLGTKESGGRCELVLLEPLDGEDGARWRALGQASKPLRAGGRLTFGGLAVQVLEACGGGMFEVRFDRGGAALRAALEVEGRLPLPPYIRARPDRGRSRALPDGRGAGPGQRGRADGGAALHGRAARPPGRGSGSNTPR